MNNKILLCLAACTLPSFGFAQTMLSQLSDAADVADVKAVPEVQALSNVRISMQRLLKSTDGQYFLSLYAGVPNPTAVLTVLKNSDAISFKGTQKGDQLVLNANVENQSQIEQVRSITGVLDANSGIFKSNLTIDQDHQSIEFQPAFKVANKPLFVFKFYGVKADTSAQAQWMTRVDVINKVNNTVVQSLTDFYAYPKSIGYMDINFDGYYDVILSDLSAGRTVEDKRFIYWMYNPKTQQYQRSPQLEKIVGFPTVHGDKQQIDFGKGQIFQVKNGLLNSLDATE